VGSLLRLLEEVEISAQGSLSVENRATLRVFFGREIGERPGKNNKGGGGGARFWAKQNEREFNGPSIRSEKTAGPLIKLEGLNGRGEQWK